MSFFVRHKDLAPVKPTPNPYPSRFPRWKQHFGIVPFLSLLLLGGVFRVYIPFYESVQQYLFEGTAWIQGAVIHPVLEGISLLREGDALLHPQQQVASLRLENEALQWKIHQLETVRHENVMLRRILKMPDVEPYHPLPMRVLATPYDGLHHVFLIAGGSRQGLEKNQAIITPKGVVGRIDKVGRSVARAVLLNDTHSRVPVMTARSEQKAILAGEGRAFPVLVYVGDIQKIVKGERVVTSGLGGVFPPGLPVGIVEDVVNGKIRVRPYVSVQKLDWIHVLRAHSTEALQEIGMALEGGEG